MAGEEAATPEKAGGSEANRGSVSFGSRERGEVIWHFVFYSVSKKFKAGRLYK